MIVPQIPLAAYLVSAALALYGFERRPTMALVFKPLTTAILLVIVGRPATTHATLVWVGVIASIAGDIALLSDSATAFLIGLGFFLVAHLAYVFAFLAVAVWPPASWAFWIGPALMAVGTPLLLRALWPRVGNLRMPVVAYGLTISAMVIAAFSTLGGPLAAAPLAAVGSLLFYVSDASLGINRFVQPIPMASFFNVGIYWLGQLGIALAARWS